MLFRPDREKQTDRKHAGYDTSRNEPKLRTAIKEHGVGKALLQQHMGQVDLCAFQAGSACVDEQLLGEFCRSNGAPFDLEEFFTCAGVFGQLGQRQLGVALHGHQQVVEVVGDSSCEDADTLQLLCIVDLRLELAKIQAERVAAYKEYTDDVHSEAYPEPAQLVEANPDELAKFQEMLAGE